MGRGRAGLRPGRRTITEVERVTANRRAARVNPDASAVTANGAVPLAGLTVSAAVGPVACWALTVTVLVALEVWLLPSVAVTVTV